MTRSACKPSVPLPRGWRVAFGFERRAQALNRLKHRQTLVLELGSERLILVHRHSCFAKIVHRDGRRREQTVLDDQISEPSGKEPREFKRRDESAGRRFLYIPFQTHQTVRKTEIGPPITITENHRPTPIKPIERQRANAIFNDDKLLRDSEFQRTLLFYSTRRTVNHQAD